MIPIDLVRKLRTSLPAVREWIDARIEESRPHAVSVIDLPFPRLKEVLPLDLLSRAKVVVVTGRVPFPPLSRMGLPEFTQMESMQTQMAGITYKDTFFINHLQRTESLHFHELVHVVQWERLGVDNFLLAYGAGLMEFGYFNSPLEQMAYSLQARFEGGRLPDNIVESVQQEADAIWKGVASSLTGV